MSSTAARRKKSSKGKHASDWSDWVWDESLKCWASYRLGTNGEVFGFYCLDDLADVAQGEYDYQYTEDSLQQSTTTSTYQDSGSPEIPRYAPPPGSAYLDSSQAPYSSSPVNPSYTTSNVEETTAALGSLTLEKGKGRANGKIQVLCQDSLHQS